MVPKFLHAKFRMFLIFPLMYANLFKHQLLPLCLHMSGHWDKTHRLCSPFPEERYQHPQEFKCGLQIFRNNLVPFSLPLSLPALPVPLLQVSFGEDMLHTIGYIYSNEAEQALGSIGYVRQGCAASVISGL